MKRILLTLCFILLMNLQSVTYSETVTCEIIEGKADGVQYANYEYGAINLRRSTFCINNIIWTGREYLRLERVDGNFAISTDLQNWQPIDQSSALYSIVNSRSGYAIDYYGNKYVMYNRVYETPVNIIGTLENGGQPSNRPMYILDEGFNLVNTIVFDAPITGVSYINGKYYCKTQDYTPVVKSLDGTVKTTIYVSDDAETWTVDEILCELPLSNGKSVLLPNGEYLKNSKLYVKSIDRVANRTSINNAKDILFEKTLLPDFDICGDMYISIERWDHDNIIKVSNDGIYWLDVDIPNVDWNSIDYCIDFNGKLFLQSPWLLIVYDIDDLRNAWYNKYGQEPVYVKLNGTLLGFDESPVLESDRTLVPMRFLFEQMGAEVTWNDATQSATATMNDTSVTFSIDNTTAKVNGKDVVMDVPARLINDKTMVPLRFLSEQLGYTVTWDEETNTATIE